MKAFAFTLICC